MFEKLESRTLQSATPLNYNGQYVNYTNNTRFEVDFKHSSTNLTSYTGDVKTGKLDYKLTATEANNKLSGQFTANGKVTRFTATLVGRTMTLTVGSNKVVYEKRIQAMNPRTAGAFEYDAPGTWSAKANAGGMLIKNADNTQQVAIVSGVSYGWIAPQTLVNNAVQHGTTLKLAKSSPIYNLGGGIYLAYEVAEVQFTAKNVKFTSDVIIASLYSSSYGVTKVGMASVTAPTSVFAQKGAVLVDVLSSIHQVSTGASSLNASSMSTVANSAANVALNAATNASSTNSAMVATPAAQPAVIGSIWTGFDYGYTFTNGFYDPGVIGNWAYGYTTAWVSPFVAAEQVYMAQTSSAFDASVAAWHAQFNAT